MKFAATLPVALALLFALGPATVRVANAGETFYIGPNNGTWNTGANWDTGVVPPSEADAVVGEFVPGRIGQMNIIFDGNYPIFNPQFGLAVPLRTLRINSIGTGAGGTMGGTNFNQTASGTVMNCASQLIGGGQFDCVYNQSAGSNNGDINLGLPEGSGTYNLSGTANLSANVLKIGVGGAVGVFNQTGGSNNSPMLIGYSGSGRGTYNMSGGVLQSEVALGTNPGGSAAFNQTGGTHTSSRIGLYTPEAVYNLTGGSLTLLNGGLVTINGGNFVIGAQAYLCRALCGGQNGTMQINAATILL